MTASRGRQQKDTPASRNWGSLIRRLRSLPEIAMRRQSLLEQLQRMEPREILDFFFEVTSGAARRKVAHLLVLEAVHQAVLSGQENGPMYELLAEVYRLARDEDVEAVARLLMIARPQQGPLGTEAVRGDPQLSSLTLGQRKYLARGHDRIRLDRLLFDPEPDVVRNLMLNPHLTEREVVRLAARRPTRAEIQTEIHQSRWGNRYRVRLALVCNPYTPTDLSLKLVGFMLHKDLLAIGQDGNLHQLVRDEARRLLQARRQGRNRQG